MSDDAARDLIARTPSYEFRSSGKLCTACGALIGNVRGDDQCTTGGTRLSRRGWAVLATAE
ncbi:MAG: hypothetical protein M3Y73_15565 [Actinomycetota bacterium]|nr:hypothetical protein [Actinomycetota bacterium]